MANKIQIKRSATNAVIPSLSNGELAFTQASNTLWIGAPDGTSGNIRVGGQMVPGTLTANQALVANSISQIDKIMTANLVANGSIWANGAVGSAAWVLTSGGAGSNAYWAAAASTVAGSNSQVQFNANGSLAGDDGFTYDGVANTLTVNGSILVGTTTVVNTTQITATLHVGNVSGSYANITGQVNTATFYAATSANVGTYFTVNSTAISAAVNTTVSGANLYVTATNTTFTSNVTISGANVDATSATLRVRDALISGNLTVSGTVTAIDTVTLQVKDNVIQLADQQATTSVFTDAVDAGVYVATGNTLNTFYSGIARISASSSNTNPYFKLYSTTVSPNNTILDTGATTGTLQAYLTPYGVGGAMVANSTAVSITANSTVAVSITANTISLATALPATSGGTGLNTYTSGDLLVANTGNALSKLGIGSDGYVLQVSSGTVTWSYLDGGTF